MPGKQSSPGLDYVVLKGYVVPNNGISALKKLSLKLAGEKSGVDYDEEKHGKYLERLLVIMDPDGNRDIKPRDISLFEGWINGFSLDEINKTLEKVSAASSKVSKK